MVAILKRSLFKYFTGAPYQSPFFAGFIAAIAGVSLWVLYRFSLISFYPRMVHANLMYFGFLWSFIAGFLMTAGPKMTQTQGPNSIEKWIPLMFVAVQIVLSFINWPLWGLVVGIVQLYFVYYFIGKRLWHRKSLPFEGFVFLLFAMGVSTIGVGLYLFKEISFSEFLILNGEAFVLNLICGVGSRLIPVFSRIPIEMNPFVAQSKKKQWIMFGFAAALNLSYLLQIFHFERWAYFSRFVFLLYFSYKYFRLFHKPALRSYLAWGAKIGIVMILAGTILPLFFLENSLALQHLTFVGGLSVITLMIGTRVTASHGGESIDIELRERLILGVPLLMAFAAIFRGIAGVDALGNFMMVAASLFLLALLLWLKRFFKILVK